ncbi:MAG TPA: hypothetical protein RMH85_20740 [Polyangiaceae bacterium LLY-WYZ-15_(1-7)]|nr:hypothetical protein [Myxococcales bacterium]MAT27350.1 hypothetical protein [Sandaracinus sp.]HJL01838.1 hypothetical protein [Polyangiaceae bacterium LLY-WYZ-15_(1-7)]HJL10914.1 hypothetical protein [Polyangiaceae bacterium LLY-WYZ-15_(1-7)]HJL34462.1 hypothetical protein [Polyangiaceae bacterium LLY-WYZ-15_(1-7)]
MSGTNRRWSRGRGWCSVCAALLALLGACAAEEAPAPGVHAELTLGQVPLPQRTIPEELWRAVPAGCEDVLGSDAGEVRLAFAEGEPALGVLVVDGEPVCVDSWRGIHLELRALDRFEGDPSPDPMRGLPVPARD